MSRGGRAVRSVVAAAVCGRRAGCGVWPPSSTRRPAPICRPSSTPSTGTGIKADMERGPEWAKANMPPERLQSARRLLELEDQLEFRCGGAQGSRQAERQARNRRRVRPRHRQQALRRPGVQGGARSRRTAGAASPARAARYETAHHRAGHVGAGDQAAGRLEAGARSACARRRSRPRPVRRSAPPAAVAPAVAPASRAIDGASRTASTGPAATAPGTAPAVAKPCSLRRSWPPSPDRPPARAGDPAAENGAQPPTKVAARCRALPRAASNGPPAPGGAGSRPPRSRATRPRRLRAKRRTRAAIPAAPMSRRAT